MSYKTYGEYKDSNVELLGKIPKNWEITKIRFLGSLQNGISKSSEYFGHGYPFISYGDVYNNDELPNKISGKANTSIDERKNYSVIKNDIFFTRTSETIDEVGITSLCTKTIENATFSGFLIRLRLFKNLDIDVNFLKYYLQSNYIRHYFAKMMIIVTRASLGQNLLKNLSILLPSTKEQQQIVKYLDKKIRIINKTIIKNKELINLLEEKRISLINQVVTKGLNPDVPMKDSGVEWIGEIPEHWNVEKIKNISQVKPSNVDKKSNDNEPSVLLCNYTDVYNNEFITNNLDFMKATASHDQIRNLSLTINDIIITKDSESADDIAVPAIVTEELNNVVCGYHLAVIRPNISKINPKFLFRSFESDRINKQFELGANGVTRFGLGTYPIINAYVCQPPLNEQKEIVEFLDNETSKIFKAKYKIKEHINLLEEYKTSLIHHVVTGKIDVRGEEI